VSGSVDACSRGRAALRVLAGLLAPGPPSKRSGRADRVAPSHQSERRRPDRDRGPCRPIALTNDGSIGVKIVAASLRHG
jgi:hypothetical protein